MPDYQQGKIYKLTGNGKIYIGSTIQHLSKRIYTHRNAGISTVQEIIADPNHQITLIELYPCSCKEELLSRERHHIENTECINKLIPIRTNDEKKALKKNLAKKYNESQYAKAYKKQYYENNKDFFLNKQHEYYLRKKAEKLALQQN
jgi:hypothetical protein